MATSSPAQLKSVSDDYWRERWTQGSAHWHKDYVQETLKTHVSFLHGPHSSPADHNCTVFVPLCGKSLDMLWLSEQGFTVVGSELSEQATEEFFKENSIPYEKYIKGSFTVFKGIDHRKIELYAGSVYNCTPDVVGHFDCIWDCNALVAVNPDDRVKYADTLVTLLRPSGRILVTTYEYDQSLRSSFPLSVPEPMVVSLFERQCSVTLVASLDMTGSYFLPKFSLPWANRLVFYIEKKCL